MFLPIIVCFPLFTACFGWFAGRVIKSSIRAGGVRNFWGKVFLFPDSLVVVSRFPTPIYRHKYLRRHTRITYHER